MPIYEYRCSACGMEKEFLQKISDPLLTTCPSCGKEALVKKLTAAGFQLKGSGWYVTDFRNNGSAPTTKDADKDGKSGGDKTAAPGDAAAGKSDDSKSDAKPATAPSGPTPSSSGSSGTGGTGSADNASSSTT